jgi:hypothetical protein
MPLQNRVTPSGEIVTDPSRGLLMGNRGCLHGQGATLGVSRWRSKLWICCLLSYKGVQRDPMPPGRWTALFFLDEATARRKHAARPACEPTRDRRAARCSRFSTQPSDATRHRVLGGAQSGTTVAVLAVYGYPSTG